MNIPIPYPKKMEFLGGYISAAFSNENADKAYETPLKVMLIKDSITLT